MNDVVKTTAMAQEPETHARPGHEALLLSFLPIVERAAKFVCGRSRLACSGRQRAVSLTLNRSRRNPVGGPSKERDWKDPQDTLVIIP
jgi:P pilus assembly chaperone PapD